MPDNPRHLRPDVLVATTTPLFWNCVRTAAVDPAYVAEWDRLRGGNLSRRGTVLDLAIDRASGRLDAELAQFVEDLYDNVFVRLGDG